MNKGGGGGGEVVEKAGKAVQRVLKDEVKGEAVQRGK